MAKRPLSPEMKAIHKKFIPANIIICIIAFVAGICMLLMPWIDLRIHIEGSKLAGILSETSSSTASVSTTSSFSTEDGGDQDSGLTKALANGLSDISIDIPINLYPMKMLGAATGGKAEIEELFNSAIGKDGAAKFLEDFIGQLVPVVVKTVIHASIDQIFDSMGDTMSEEDRVVMEKYKDEVNTALEEISKNPTKENAKAQFNKIVDGIVAESSGNMSSEEVQNMRDMIDNMVEQGVNADGEFDYIYLIKNFDMEALEGSSSSDSTATPTSSVKDGAIASTFATPFDTTDSSQSTDNGNAFTEVIKMLENPGSLIADSLDEETIQTLNVVFTAIFVIFIGIPVFFCFLLALCALLRIFTKKKRVRYWYVKFILFISTVIVVAFNLVAKVLLPSLNLGAQADAILGAFSITFLGSGVVNAVCWVILTLLSLFYYRRVKKQIKRQKREEGIR